MNISVNNFRNISVNNFAFGSKQKGSQKASFDSELSSDKFEHSKQSDMKDYYVKGVFGQNIYDELDGLNKLDPSSVYYDPNNSGLIFAPESEGWYTY